MIDDANTAQAVEVADAAKLPLVILPGIDGTAEVRSALLRRLRRDREVTLIEYAAATPADYHKLYDFLLPKMPDGKFVVLGESYSGPIATLIASRMKERVAGLILAVTFVTPPLPAPFRAITRWLGTGFLPHAVTDWILMNSEKGPVRDAMHSAIETVPDAAITARALAALSVDARGALASVACPVLALEAKRDRLILGHCSRAIAESAPRRYHVLIDGPHMILETNVEESAQVIERFCKMMDEQVQTPELTRREIDRPRPQ